MARYLPPEQLQHLMWKAGEAVPPRLPPLPPEGSVLPSDIQYILMDKTKKYALGVHALRDACIAEDNPNHPKHRTAGQELYRLLTFKEGAIARLTEFNRLVNPDGSDRTLDERVKLMLRWNDSCTGTAYQAKSTKFKIIPVCEPLILIDRDYNSGFLTVPYDSFEGIDELDSSKGIYNAHITKQQIEDHECWRAAFENDVALLRNYRDAVFEAIQLRRSDKQMPEKAMGFWVRQNTPIDELRALFVDNLAYYSNAGGNFLDRSGSFVRASPVEIFFEK